MTTIGSYAIGFSALMVGFQFVAYRLELAAQPERLELAKRGEEFLAKDDLHPLVRGHVQFLLATAFGMRGFLFLCLLCTPVFVLVALFRPKAFAEMGHLPITDEPSTAIAFRDICRLHYRVIIASHPVLRPLVQVEIVIITAALLIGSAITGVLAPSIGRVEPLVIACSEWIESLWRKSFHTTTGARA